MRICVLIDAWEPIRGGGQTHVWEVSKRLVIKNQLEIDIFTRALTDHQGQVYDQNKSHFKGKLNIFRIKPSALFFNPLARLIWLYTSIFIVWRQHLKNPYDLIHGHAYSAAIPAKLLGIILKVPVVFTVHGCNNLDLYPNKLITQVERLLLTKIAFDQQISVSKHFLQYENINRKIEVIPNGVDVGPFDQQKRINIRSDSIKLLWIGRFDKVKGIDILVQAFSRLVNQKLPLQLILVGSGRTKTDIKQLVSRLNINQHVKFKNARKWRALIKLYKSADIFVLPSLSEGQSITMLEAWAAKLPVVTTRVGDNQLLVKDGVNGYLVNPGDVADLIKALIKAIKNPQLKKIGLKGYQLVKNKYSWDNSAKHVLKAYQNIL